MSGEGGLQKLTEYLNQTRRQAETAIDTLNERIFELEASNASLSKANDELNIERSYLKDTIEQLKGENSRKWRLQERDDWKSLVDSVQADRVRLQEENMQLTLQLEAASVELERQESRLDAVESHASFPSSPGGNTTSPIKLSPGSPEVVDEHGQNRSFSVRVSPDGDVGDPSGIRIPSMQTETVSGQGNRSHAGRGFLSQPGSPSPRVSSGIIQQLKLEIEKINNQRLVEKQIADAEISGLKDEIERLHRQLELARGHGADTDLDQPLVGGPDSGDTDLSGVGTQQAQTKWSLSFGLWDYFFSPSDAPDSVDVILRV